MFKQEVTEQIIAVFGVTTVLSNNLRNKLFSQDLLNNRIRCCYNRSDEKKIRIYGHEVAVRLLYFSICTLSLIHIYQYAYTQCLSFPFLLAITEHRTTDGYGDDALCPNIMLLTTVVIVLFDALFCLCTSTNENDFGGR